MEFIKEHPELIFGAAVVTFFLFRLITILKKAKLIDDNGLITEAVVTKVEENWDPDTAGSSYTTYVQYHDENDVLRESPMALTMTAEHQVGEKIIIRFIPGYYEMVREAEE